MQKTISIIMPIYKVSSDLLRKSLESIISQTYLEWELLLINDGSDGEEETICKEYCNLDKRIKYFEISNSGVSTARNIGLSKAEGMYTIFVDSDDTLMSEYLSVLYEAMVADDVDVVIASCNHVYEDDVQQKKVKYEECIAAKDQLLDCLYYMAQPYEELEITAVWGKIYRTSIARSICFNPYMHIGEDFDFNCRYFNKIEKGKYISYQGYNYVIRNNSAIRSLFNERKRDTFIELERLTEKNNDNIGYVSRVVNIAIILLIMAFNSECDVDFENISLFIKKYRLRVMCNKKSRKKVKLALFFSYFGFRNMARLFMVIS